MITVIVQRVRHDGGMRVSLKLPYDQEVIDLIKTIQVLGQKKKVQGKR